MQEDGACSEETILKEHIRLLEDRVKELVSQNFKLVQRLTQAEESILEAELRHDDLAVPKSTSKAKVPLAR